MRYVSGTQLSSCSPGTLANSSVLFVTRVARWLRAWAAINVSREPIGVPHLSRVNPLGRLATIKLAGEGA